MMEIVSQDCTVLRLERGERLLDQLNRFAYDHVNESYWLNGIGAAENPEIGYYDLASQEYVWRVTDGLYEILNLTGNLSWVGGEPVWHVHGTFAGSDFAAIGGHVRECIVGATCEIRLTKTAPMTRQFDEKTGLKLLHETE